MKRLKQYLASVFAVMTLAAPAVVPAVVHADDITSKEQICKGVEFNKDASGCSTTRSGSDPVALIKKVVQFLIIIIGAISVIMIIFGGFKYITSGGDSNNVQGAKNTIMYAIIGLVIVLFAQGIVTFVLNKATEP